MMLGYSWEVHDNIIQYDFLITAARRWGTEVHRRQSQFYDGRKRLTFFASTKLAGLGLLIGGLLVCGSCAVSTWASTLLLASAPLCFSTRARKKQEVLAARLFAACVVLW